jgi:hypothetical protein
MLDCFICNSLFQLKKWSFKNCDITIDGIKDIIEHCKELCYLKLENMFNGLVFNIIKEQLLQTGKVDLSDNFPRGYNAPYGYNSPCGYFKISKYAQSALTHESNMVD